MPNMINAASSNRVSANQVGGGCACCRSGACSACKSCPSCSSCRNDARSTLQQLKQMLGQDPSGTKNGVADALGQDPNLANNKVLMKILGLLGLAPGGAA